MDLKLPIPSRIVIGHHAANMLYRGQIAQCFRCEQTGHVSHKLSVLKKTTSFRFPCIVGATAVSVDSALPVPSTVVPNSNNSSLSAKIPSQVELPPPPDISSSNTILYGLGFRFYADEGWQTFAKILLATVCQKART